MLLTSPQATATVLGLGAVLAWGLSDFLGGWATRKADAFLLTSIAHASGMLLMLALSLSSRASFPPPAAVRWAVLAGLCGGAALALFYRVLASGQMGLMAPISAVLGAGIPTAFGFITQGFPGPAPIAGFVFAAVGIWLISRSEDGRKPEGIGLAVIAGCGFAGFYICAHEAGSASATWLAAIQKTASLALTGGIVCMRRNFRQITASGIFIGIIAGGLDVTGTFLFIRANQIGRLDRAVVLTSLYPAVTVFLARIFLKEHFTRWRVVGILAALVAVPLISS